MQRLSKWILSAAIMGSQAGLALAGGQADPMPVTPPAPVATPMTTAPVIVNGYDNGYGYSDGYSDGGGMGMHLIAEIGFMSLTPHWRSNPGLTIAQTVAGGGTLVALQDFDFNSQLVPQIAVGFVGEGGLGVRVGWWGFSRGSEPLAATTAAGRTIIAPGGIPVGGGAGVSAFATAKLRMDVWDFEAVDQLQAGQWSLLFGGGIRYAHLGQAAAFLTTFGAANPTVIASATVVGHNFNGAGPTFSLDARRQIGGSGIYLYCDSRASLLFGDSKQATAIVARGAPAAAFAPVVAAAANNDNSLLPALDAGVGAGWQRMMGGARAFAEIGLVGQVWFEAGNSTRTAAATIGPVDNNLGLAGFSFKLGLDY